jgi:hypothetical protein
MPHHLLHAAFKPAFVKLRAESMLHGKQLPRVQFDDVARGSLINFLIFDGIGSKADLMHRMRLSALGQ